MSEHWKIGVDKFDPLPVSHPEPEALKACPDDMEQAKDALRRLVLELSKDNVGTFQAVFKDDLRLICRLAAMNTRPAEDRRADEGMCVTHIPLQAEAGIPTTEQVQALTVEDRRADEDHYRKEARWLRSEWMRTCDERDALKAQIERHPEEMRQAAQMGEACMQHYLIERLTSDEAVGAVGRAVIPNCLNPDWQKLDSAKLMAKSAIEAALRVAKGEG